MSFDKLKFDRVSFDASFSVAINAIKQAEDTTRREVRALSRSVLQAFHCTENAGYLNQFLAVLTPIHKQHMVLYFQAFSGFHYDTKLEQFTKKDKVTYPEKEVASLKFLDDPMNNFWSWSQREVKVEAKEFTLDAVTKATETFLKKAAKNHFKQVDVLRAILKAGITAESIIAVMGDVGYDVNVVEEGRVKAEV